MYGTISTLFDASHISNVLTVIPYKSKLSDEITNSKGIKVNMNQTLTQNDFVVLKHTLSTRMTRVSSLSVTVCH